MAKIKSLGTLLAIASAFGATKNITGATNATSCVVTLEASHGVVVGDIVEILTCTWGSLERRVARASAVSTNDVTLEGIDTSDTTKFPAGTITGTLREISTWTNIDNRTRDFSASGGDLSFDDVSTLDDPDDRELPGSRSPVGHTFPGYFDPGKAWVSTVRTASDRSDTPVPVRESYVSGAKLYASAYWSFRETPTPESNTLRDEISLRFAAKPTVYSA